MSVSSRNNASPIDIAYAAGFFDGEGSLSIIRTERAGRPKFRAAGVVMNTNLAILQSLAALFGGRVYAHEFKAKPKNWRPGYQWQLAGAELEEFLHVVGPYLRLKQPLASNLIRFLALKREARHRQPTIDLELRMSELHAVHSALITRGKIDDVEIPEVAELPQLRLLGD